MALKVDMRKIVRAEVIPWEVDEDLYGVAYTTADGMEHSERVGTEAQAEQIVQAIADQKVVAFGAAVDRD